MMTAVEINAELFRTMGEIADDEGLMLKLLKYAKKLAAKKNDPTLMDHRVYLNIKERDRFF